MGKSSLLTKTKTSLGFVLTPQQAQYLKMLQLPITSLEHTIKQEIDENPFLEEVNDLIDSDELIPDINAPAPDQIKVTDDNFYTDDNKENDSNYDSYNPDFSNLDSLANQNYSEKELDNFNDNDYDYYSEQWEDDADYNPGTLTDSDKDYESFQLKSETTLYDSLVEQVNVFDLSDEEKLIAFYVIGSIDDDGYLRRDDNEITIEINSIISIRNREIQIQQYELNNKLEKEKKRNPAKQYELNSLSVETLLDTLGNHMEILKDINTQNFKNKNADRILKHITEDDVNKIIKIIQTLEPPGIAARNLQECLIAQLKAKNQLTENESLALHILEIFFEEFSKKHFLKLQKKLTLTENDIKNVFEEIKKLNPKPGADIINSNDSIVPDFIVKYDDKLDDFTITLNDTNVPMLKVSQVYQKILLEAKKNKKTYNKSTRDWMKERYENAKNFIQAIKQRNITMLMIMTSIVYQQREFFLNDIKKLKPMVYQVIAEDTGFDISTICRVVNGKYVQASSGIYELKFFFTDSLLSFDGEEISTAVIRNRLKEIIDGEPKSKPYNDDKLTNLLKKEGYNIARRTVTKYRETLKIPIARLRKEM